MLVLLLRCWCWCGVVCGWITFWFVAWFAGLRVTSGFVLCMRGGLLVGLLVSCLVVSWWRLTAMCVVVDVVC